MWKSFLPSKSFELKPNVAFSAKEFPTAKIVCALLKYSFAPTSPEVPTIPIESGLSSEM